MYFPLLESTGCNVAIIQFYFAIFTGIHTQRELSHKVGACESMMDLVLGVDLLLIVLKNNLWLVVGVQDVVRLWIRRDESPILNSWVAEAGREGEVVIAGQDYLQEGDKDAEDWEWDEVDVLIPWEMNRNDFGLWVSYSS